MFGKLKTEKETLERQVASLESTKARLNAETNELNERLKLLRDSIETQEVLSDFGIKTITPNNLSCSELESKKATVLMQIQELAGSDYSTRKLLPADGLWRVDERYAIEGSRAKGNDLQKAVATGCLYAFNAYVEQKEKACSVSSLALAMKHATDRFNTLQRKTKMVGVSLNSRYASLRIELMRLNVLIKEQAKAERIKLREEKRLLKEQEQLLLEIEAETRKLKEERLSMELAYGRTLNDEEARVLKQNITNIDRRIASLQYRARNKKAGFVYVISSPSLPRIQKIGVTRRLSPYTRVRELSSSSLPEPFALNAYCFCDDAFDIESKMHAHFDSKRVSPNREFFYITVDEAVNALKNIYGQEVRYGNKDLEELEENNEKI